jgi:hypothetical protein
MAEALAGAACTVYVYREGALAAIGHDLALRVGDLRIEVEGAAGTRALRVQASCQTASVRVAGALRRGTVNESQPSAGDRTEIERNIACEVLETDRYPVAAFRSSSVEPAGSGYRIAGSLDLHGVCADIGFTAERRGDRLVARFPLDQTTFHIKPFRALMGALRVKPQVVVEISVPLPPAGAVLPPGEGGPG